MFALADRDTASQGALSATGAGAATSGTVLLASSSSIGVAAAGVLTLTGVVSGTGSSSLTKVTAGELVLGGSGSNTYTGKTIVTGGTLSLNKSGGAIAIAGDGVTQKVSTLEDILVRRAPREPPDCFLALGPVLVMRFFFA